MTRIFLTGGTGFVGARLLPALRAAGARVVALSRRPPAGDGATEWVTADLLDAPRYTAALRGVDVVLHAAAATGRATAAEHARVNADGTRALLAAAREAGVSRFVLVSSIAVRFPDLRHYPYARAKQDAEAAVKAGGLIWTVARPTMVTGPGAPVLEGLRRLASLPLVPVFGSGRARVQPIWIDDLTALLTEIAIRGRAARQTVELGGPDVVTIETLLLALRRAVRGGVGRVVHLPVGPLQALLAALERFADGLLPLTAGQLCTFRYDGVADPHPFTAGRTGLSLADQIARSLAA